MRVVVFLALVSALPHAFAARWLLASFPALGARRRAVIATAAALALAPALLRVAIRLWPSSLLTTVVGVSLIELAALMIASVPLAFVMALGWLVTKVLPTPSARPSPPKGDDDKDGAPVLGRREVIERVAGVSSFGAASVALGWGDVRGRHEFEVREVVVRVAGWPRVLEGYVIAQVSDVHVGAFVGERELDEGFALVARVRPDLVVATGDLVDFVAELASPLAARLAAVGARDGAFAIMGNHDHYAGAPEVARRVRAAGVRVLANEGITIRPGDGGGFALLGVDDLQGRRARAGGQSGFSGPDLGAALAMVRAGLPRILLAHQPQFFREAADRVALQLSGHTHGGQINPGVHPARLLLRYVEGRYTEGTSTLWVNRGFGTVGPPTRIGAPPEITKIVVVAA